MNRTALFFSCPLSLGLALFLSLLVPAGRCPAQEEKEDAGRILLAGDGTGLTFKTESPQVTLKAGPGGIRTEIRPGPADWPGIVLTAPDGQPFDFSAYSRLSARLRNDGPRPCHLTLRIDDDGDWKTNPFNAEAITLEPGQSAPLDVYFGYSFGRKKGHPLKTKAVTRMLVFAGKTDETLTFTVEALKVSGKAGETPPSGSGEQSLRRVVPREGILAGPGVPLDAVRQLKTTGGARAGQDGGTSLRVFLAGKPREKATVSVHPSEGRWDLSSWLQMKVQLRNAGTTAVAPELHLESNGGPSDTIKSGSIGPGVSQTVVIPFQAAQTWVGASDAHLPDSKNANARPGSRLVHDAVSAVVMEVPGTGTPAELVIESITASLPPVPVLPDWLGRRPPVKGDWTLTFEDNFDGTAPDPAKWNVQGPNYWDKASAFSRDNVTVRDGLMKLRYEKRTTRHNDDPKEKEFQYAVGFLTGYDRWAQRYGYFEARTKLPTAPGLWPAFWLMPDRGRNSGEPWKRSSTENGGMEFDIVEHLTRWGPFRYNIAMHWDGYGEAHKAIGTSSIYVQPDKEGFVTTGLLWLPGQAVYYFNGSEVARWEHPAIAKVPCHMMFTLPQGGWDNNEIDDSRLPDFFTADYVRVWQRRDLASHADSPPAH